jgi:hypothetical protein
MAENDKRTESVGAGASKAASAPAATTTSSAAHGLDHVVVIEKKKRKKKKRKYTRGLKGIQRLQRGASRSSWRIGDAVADGLKEFRKRNDRSSRKRRDGALRDTFKNMSRAAGEVLRGSGKAPYDFAKRLPNRAIWKQVRPAVQFLAWPFPR